MRWEQGGGGPLHSPGWIGRGIRRLGEAKLGCMAAVGMGQPERLNYKDKGPPF